jgi:hypothetical protein
MNNKEPRVEHLLHSNFNAVRAQPQLAHINLEIGKARAGHAYLKIKALHDSGCAASLIKKDIFDQIPDRKNIYVTPKPDTYVVSVTGEKTPVYGAATIFLRFTGENGVIMVFPLEVHIHDNVEHDFLLGRDFTGSSAKLLETKNHMYLTFEDASTDMEDFWERAKHTSCHVPIVSTSCKTYDVQTVGTVTIPPFSLMSVQCQYTDNQIMPIPLQSGQPIAFEVINVQQARLECPKALYSYEDSNEILIPVYNHTQQD